VIAPHTLPLKWEVRLVKFTQLLETSLQPIAHKYIISANCITLFVNTKNANDSKRYFTLFQNARSTKEQKEVYYHFQDNALIWTKFGAVTCKDSKLVWKSDAINIFSNKYFLLEKMYRFQLVTLKVVDSLYISTPASFFHSDSANTI
jgi:hypothetical protein